MNKQKKEKIKNIPNTLTFLRILITLLIVYMIFKDYQILEIVVFFVIGMITDALDGHVARKYNQTTEFGRRFDIIADRFLLLGTVISLLIHNFLIGYFNHYDMILIGMTIAREIIATPSVLFVWISELDLPQVRIIGKLVTVLQSISFPMILLKWDIAIYFAVLTLIIGLISGCFFIYDSTKLFKQKYR